MRRGSVLLLIAIMLMLLVGAVGCGDDSNASLAPGDDSPEAILAAAIASAETMTSAAGTFDFEMSYDVDTSGMPEEMLPYLSEPTTMSGTFAFANDPQAIDLSLTMGSGGQTTQMGLKSIDKQVWISLLEQWYEGPPDIGEMMGESSFDEAKIAEIMNLVKELGVDPVTWLKDLRLVGEETLDGVAVYHLAGAPDVAKMMADVIGLMQSEEFMALIDPTGTMGDSAGTGELIPSMPSADELQEMQSQIADVFKDFTVDLWIAKEGQALRKAAMVAHITPPTGEEAAGFNAMDLSVTVSLQQLNEPVTVQPPASALPYSELEKAMEENPEMFMGPLMGLSGAGLGYGDETVTTSGVAQPIQ